MAQRGGMENIEAKLDELLRRVASIERRFDNFELHQTIVGAAGTGLTRSQRHPLDAEIAAHTRRDCPQDTSCRQLDNPDASHYIESAQHLEVKGIPSQSSAPAQPGLMPIVNDKPAQAAEHEAEPAASAGGADEGVQLSQLADANAVPPGEEADVEQAQRGPCVSVQAPRRSLPNDAPSVRVLLCPTTFAVNSELALQAAQEIRRDPQVIQPNMLPDRLSLGRGCGCPVDFLVLEGNNTLEGNRQLCIAKVLGSYVKTHGPHGLLPGEHVTFTDNLLGEYNTPRGALLPVTEIISDEEFVVSIPDRKKDFNVSYEIDEHERNLAQVHRFSPPYAAILHEAQERKNLGIKQLFLVVMLGHLTAEVARELALLGVTCITWPNPNDARGARAFVGELLANLPAPEGQIDFLMMWRDKYLRNRFDELLKQHSFKENSPEWHSLPP